MNETIDWSREAILGKRDAYFAATQRAFVPYQKPLIIRRGFMQHVWDEDGNRLTDLLGMNLASLLGIRTLKWLLPSRRRSRN